MQKVRRFFFRLLILFKFDKLFLFHSFPKVLFKFPSQYSVRYRSISIVFKIRKWASCLQTDFLEFRLTLILLFFQFDFLFTVNLFPFYSNSFFNFAHHYFQNHFYFFFPFGTEMFHFPKFFFSISVRILYFSFVACFTQSKFSDLIFRPFSILAY